MAVSVRVEVNNRLIQRLLRSPAGPLARNMLTRGNAVRRAAQRRINSRTGDLARSIDVQIVEAKDGVGVRVGTSLHYARYVHDGTGVHGPRGEPIRPTVKRALAFGDVVVAKSSGQRGTNFLRAALDAAR